jgi:hypothetical protein
MSIEFDGRVIPFGYQQINDLSTPQSLRVPSGAQYALIQAANQAVRWLDTGSDPTDSIGMRLSSGRDMWYTGDLGALRFIEETAGAELNVAYYRPS